MNIFNASTSVSELIEPVIITYNRAPQLQATLQAFANSIFSNHTLHVLDNASTDETPLIVKTMQAQFKNLIYHRNAYNIGGNGNILRSIEITQSKYHWVMGDDDQWLLNTDNIQELMSTLHRNEADIVRLGWLVSQASRGHLKPANELIKAESLFFASLSMISATLIKRSIMIQYLPQAYLNISDSYPQLIPPILAIEKKKLEVYTLSEDLMKHTPSEVPGYFCGDLEWYAGWFRTSRFFSNVKLKKGFVREATYYMCRAKPGIIREQIWLTKVLLYYKSFGLNQSPYLCSMLAYGTGRRFSVIGLMLINLIPAKILFYLRKLYFKLYQLPNKTINIDRTRL